MLFASADVCGGERTVPGQWMRNSLPGRQPVSRSLWARYVRPADDLRWVGRISHSRSDQNIHCVSFAALQLKVVEKSGLNRDGTYLPPAIHPSFAKEPQYDMKTAMVEAEMVMGGVVADVLEKTGAPGNRGCLPLLLLCCSIFWAGGEHQLPELPHADMMQHLTVSLACSLQASSPSRWTSSSQTAASSAPPPVWHPC